MAKIRVAVQGALGKMGREVVRALCENPEMMLVGAVDAQADEGHLHLPDGSGNVPLSTEVDTILSRLPDVLVDFSTAKAVMPAVRKATEQHVHLVIGTTGITTDDLNEIERLAKAHKVGAVVAPNFALGAVVMIHLAKVAAKFFDYAEIIELHHQLKADAPSGTALSTARAMAQAKGKPFQHPEPAKPSTSRGQDVEGIAIHSVRLLGLLAHQEVLLGTQGQTLSIRHDTISRECYMPGIMLAVKEVVKRQGLVYGLDALLGL